MHLTRGANTALPSSRLRFTAVSDTALDMSALVVDANLRALSSETFVFYNQPSADGIRLGAGGVEIDLDAVHPDAHAVLCIVSVDPLAASTAALSAIDASLADASSTGAAGARLAGFAIDCRAGETAVICWEVYRRAGQWKVRAVGQGYADGLAGLITRHGVDVDDDPEPAPQPTAPQPAAIGAGQYGPIEPLDPDHIADRFVMIMEDAARTTSALTAATRFAEHRLDRELTAAVADPSTRNGPQAADARAHAQRRHDDVLAEARTRYIADTGHLDAELRAIAPQLPRSFADWQAPAWTTGAPAAGGSDGIRVGEVSAPDCGPLRIPVVLAAPFRRPLHVLGADTPATAAVTTALILRTLATDPRMSLDVVDLAGSLGVLGAGLGRRNGTTATSPEEVGPYLEATVAAAELALLDLGRFQAAPHRPRLIVLNHFPYGYDQGQLPHIEFLAERGPALGISTIVVTDDPEALAAIHHGEPGRGHGLLALDNEDWRDPWTSSTWTFTPDRSPADPQRLARVLAQLAAGQ